MPVETSEETAAVLPVSDVIGCDFACTKCGYNLRTLRLDAMCPECGTPTRTGLPEDERLYISRIPEDRANREIWLSWLLVMSIAALPIPILVLSVVWWESGAVAMLRLGPILAIVVGWNAYSSRRTLRRVIFDRRVVIGRDSVVWREAGRPDIRIDRHDVRQIVADRDGLTVRARSSARYVDLSRWLPGFEHIRRHFEVWSPIQPKSAFRTNARIVLISLGLVVAMTVHVRYTDPIAVTLAGLAVAGGLLWAMWSTMRAQTITRLSRIVRMAALGGILLMATVRTVAAWLT